MAPSQDKCGFAVSNPSDSSAPARLFSASTSHTGDFLFPASDSPALAAGSTQTVAWFFSARGPAAPNHLPAEGPAVGEHLSIDPWLDSKTYVSMDLVSADDPSTVLAPVMEMTPFDELFAAAVQAGPKVDLVRAQSGDGFAAPRLALAPASRACGLYGSLSLPYQLPAALEPAAYKIRLSSISASAASAAAAQGQERESYFSAPFSVSSSSSAAEHHTVAATPQDEQAPASSGSSMLDQLAGTGTALECVAAAALLAVAGVALVATARRWWRGSSGKGSSRRGSGSHGRKGSTVGRDSFLYIVRDADKEAEEKRRLMGGAYQLVRGGLDDVDEEDEVPVGVVVVEKGESLV